MPFDFFGREIHPGATVVYAALVGRSAVLKSGQVIATFQFVADTSSSDFDSSSLPDAATIAKKGVEKLGLS